MNIKWSKRLLLIVHWLLSVAMFALLIALWIFQPSREELLWFLPNDLRLPIVIGAGCVVAIFLIWTLTVFLKHRNKREDRGFIVVETSDSGKVRLSIPVIEQMVRQAAATVEGVRDIKPVITGMDDAIDVALNATMENGVHVPTVTVNLQRAIRQYVELNCGISVHQVTVSILSVARPEENERRLLKPALPVARKKDELVREPETITDTVDTMETKADLEELEVKEEKSAFDESFIGEESMDEETFNQESMDE